MWHHVFCVMGVSEEHLVTVREENGQITVSCDCSAGSYGKNCRHKLAVLGGDPAILELSRRKDFEAYDHLAGMLVGSEGQELARHFHELKCKKEQIDAEIRKVRRKLERAMKKGFEISS